MKKKPLRKCPLCENTNEVDVLHTQSFAFPEEHILFEARRFDVVYCVMCGMVYNDTPLNQEVYNRFYSQMSKYDMDYNSIDINRFKGQALLIERIFPHKKKAVLDVGSGGGGLLVALKNIGYTNLSAVDPSVQCVNAIKEKGINAFESNLFDLRMDEKFDLILLSHVMEHVVNLNNAIDRLKKVLNPSGMIYIEVPNALKYTDYYLTPFHFFDVEHINHFGIDALIELGKKNGLVVAALGERIFEVSSNVNYPAIYVLFRLHDGDMVNLKVAISEYIEKSTMNLNDNKLLEIAESKKKVYVWGAGAYTLRMLENTYLKECNIQAFIDKDKNKQGLKIIGKEVLPPEDIMHIDKDSILLVCSAVYSDDILEEIKKMNITNFVYVVK